MSPGPQVELMSVAVSDRHQWRFLRLRMPDGRVGIGECSDSGPLPGVIEAMEKLAPNLSSQPIAEGAGPDEVRAWADRALDQLPDNRFARTALGGVELALSDIAARDRDLPVWRWLTERDDKPAELVRCYANINRVPGGRTPAEVARAAQAAVDAGFATVKCAPFDVPDPDRSLIDIGLDRLGAVRAAIGDEVTLLVDCHLRLGLDDILSALPELHRLRLGWLEDAVDIDDLAGLRRLREHTDLTLAGGEFSHRSDQVTQAALGGLIDVFMPDVKHAGGITRAHALATGLGDVQASPHNPCGPVATAASAHLYRSLPSATTLEVAVGEADWRGALIRPAERIENGWLTPASGPGLGLEIDDRNPKVQFVWSTTLEESL